MSSFFDYYGGRPPIEDPQGPTTPTIPPPPPPGQGPIDPRYVLRRQYREEDPTEPDYRIQLISGSNPALNASALQVINPEDVIHGDFNTYLDSVGMDRSGKFSGAALKGDPPDIDTAQSAAGDFASVAGRGLEMAAGMAFGMDALVTAPSLTDPTGLGTRSTGGGIFAPLATARVSREFKDLNAIATFNSDPANSEAVGNAKGFMLRLGDERGSILYRLPGESRYRGDLRLKGIDIPQDVARNIENYTLGVDSGQALLSAISSGKSVLDQAMDDVDFSTALIQTGRGGYTLDGKFNFVTGVAKVGNLSDLIDARDGLAGTAFRVTNGGKYNAIESQRIAKSWANGARNFNAGTPVSALVAHLQAHIEMATKASDAMTPAKTVKKPGPVVTTTTTTDGDGGPPPPASGDTGGGDDSGPPQGRGSGYDFTSRPAEERAMAQAAEREREYTFDPFSDIGRFMAEGGFVGMQEGGLNAARPGFVEDEDRLVPESSTLTVNELQGNVEESGFIDRPPSEVTDAESVADNIPIPEAEEDGYVINVEAVKRAGEMDLIREIEEAENYVKRKGIELDKPKRPVLASSGEIYVRPEVVAAMGLDKLEKINKRGVPETKKKLKRTRRV